MTVTIPSLPPVHYVLPENKLLEAPAGAKLTFEFRGNELTWGYEAAQGRVSHPFTRGLNASAGSRVRQRSTPRSTVAACSCTMGP
jgi:hypothetical protein